MKSLIHLSSDSQFRMAVQQQLQDNDRFLNQPDTLSTHLSFNVTELQTPTVFSKNTDLQSITFVDFQEFCQKFCEEMRIKALIQGNVTENHALNMMTVMLNELKFKKIENVSEKLFFCFQNERSMISDSFFVSFGFV